MKAAIHDPITAILVRAWERRYRTGMSSRAFGVAGIAFCLVFWGLAALVDHFGLPGGLTALTPLLLAVLWVPLPGSNSTWVNHCLPHLHSHPWRQTPARVLRAGRWSAVIEATGDDPAVYEVRIDPAHLAMITDSVDLVRGPGKWAVLRVPGSRELFPAKLSRSVVGVAGRAVGVAEPEVGVLGSGAAERVSGVAVRASVMGEPVSVAVPETGVAEPAMGMTELAAGMARPVAGATARVSGSTVPETGVAEPAMGVTGPVAGAVLSVAGAAERVSGVAVPVSGMREPAAGAVPVVGVARLVDGVTERWARTLRDRMLLVFAQLVLVWGVVLVGLFLVAAHYVVVMWLVVVVISGLSTALVVGHRGRDLVLPRLVGSGEWVRADAVLGVWKARRDGTARVAVVLRFADGSSREAVLPAASVDLVGAVADSSSLWIAGTGSRAAVGFPGLPHAAYARVG
ncbi:hypothetical protein [Actinokineospora cianjurensis]|uniref:Uncharacterized protein n=1 Tax=Actinokineospora cianjurensis TaxID=585224 RepID=A0A421AZQ3_9PSEU|nr:hypothetical protein [Actinokineospora cianjurensis]RLK55333.1 hypothetical protein CLV68_4818 [Actinokineospora cianjurensis]